MVNSFNNHELVINQFIHMISSVPTNNAMNYVHSLDSRQVPNYI